ncbi:MAG: type II toxin-antitoxin system RelE/ParE family toxin [Gammaproteobacteria bacterium]|nr:type II toxin-antitoxin system RelE/ParE family toxin [Gammaproteobacteria bacterium]
MIRTFADKASKELFEGTKCHRQFRPFQAAAERKLAILNSATSVRDLESPPGNRLEKLKGDRSGQWSIRINDQWRLVFDWDEVGSEARNVEIVDYY